MVGSGAYGFVVAADDVVAKKQVAIKKIANTFDNILDAKRILREIRLMRHFNHPNVVKLYDVIEPLCVEDFEDVYIVTELMSTDLQKILSSKAVLSMTQQKYLLYQILAGMNYINSANVLHRDVKPSNLLVDVRTCHLQICDFGLARAVCFETITGEASNGMATYLQDQADTSEVSSLAEYTEYVVTRWYRAPEIM